MSNIAVPPPSALNESCTPFTAPVEVSVVDVANNAVPGTPKRTSLPFSDDPATAIAVPQCRSSAQVIVAAEPAQMRPITEAIT